MRQLTDNFLLEVLKFCFTKKSFLEVCREHLKYQYIPIERSDIKVIYKSILDYFNNTNTLPSIGIISQQHETKSDVQETLNQIKEVSISDSEQILNQLEGYIKRVSFQLLNERVVELYTNEKYDEAIALNTEESQKINELSITKGTSYFTRVMKDFSTRMNTLKLKNEEDRYKDKIPFSIPPLDVLTYGGIEKKETVLFIAQSGVGKSTVLKWVGLSAARLKYKILHIQLEGSEEECFLKYSQMWTAENYHNLRDISIGGIDIEKYYEKAQMFEMKGTDVLIHAYEQLEEASVIDVKNAALLFEKEEGQMPDLILIDSLDLLHPGDGLKYGYDTQAVKMRLNNTAKRIKNLAMELDTRIICVTQTCDISPEKIDDPDFVITRHHTEGDKTLVKSFSFVFTLNQTTEEYKKDIMRLYADKLRHFKAKQIYKIFTAYDSGRFIDIKRTRKLYEESSEE